MSKNVSSTSINGQHITTSGTELNLSSMSSNITGVDTLVCIYNGTTYYCYTTANTAGTDFGNDQYNNVRGNTMRVVVGTWWYPDTASGGNYSGSLTSELIANFRFYNRALNSSEITNALAGTYPSQ